MKIKILWGVLILLTTQAGWAQIMFQRHYGGTADEYGCKVLQTSDGGYMVAAITESYGNGYRDIYLIRTNELGDTLWTKTIGGTGGEQPNSMKATSDGNFIIAGSTSSYGAGNYDVFLLKVDQNGDTIWTKTYGGSLDDDGCDVTQTSDGGYIIVGGTMSFTSGFSSVYAIRTNASGDSLWTKIYEKKSANSGFSVIELSDGGFFIMGETLLPGQQNTSDCYFLRTNISGDTIWTKTYGGSDKDFCACGYDTGTGSIIVSGTTKSYGNGGYDIFLSLLNYSGDEIWMKTYGGTGDDYGGMFAITNDGGYIITGYTESFGSGNLDMYLIKTDNNGDTLWTRTFGYSNNEWGASVKQTSDNGYIISGYTNSLGNGYEVYLVKTNSGGVSGFQQIINQNIECKVYPNPCLGQFNLEFVEPTLNGIFVRIFNNAGKLVLEKEYKNLNGNIYQFSVIELPSGIYTLNIIVNSKYVSKRIIIQN